MDQYGITIQAMLGLHQRYSKYFMPRDDSDFPRSLGAY